MSSQGDSASKHSATFFLGVFANTSAYVESFTSNGLYFNIGDSITIPGKSLGTPLGATGAAAIANDATISVASLNTNSSIKTVTLTGTAGVTGTFRQYGPFEFKPPSATGYTFKDFHVRDSSDWITLKKQAILSASKTPVAIKGESYSNNSRLNLKEGKYKVGAAFGCSGCFGDAFTGN